MTNVEKLTNVNILIDDREEADRVIKIIKKIRPNVKLGGAKRELDYILTDFRFYPQVFCLDLNNAHDRIFIAREEFMTEHVVKKIETIILFNKFPKPDIYCGCGGPGKITGFGTLSFMVCMICKKEKK